MNTLCATQQKIESEGKTGVNGRITEKEMNEIIKIKREMRKHWERELTKLVTTQTESFPEGILMA